ncbi:hypothetical protein [Natrinema pallidum]|uniref:Uncharacterized protein n=1 Tax=Natrinema pallidum DSM 3751 TaxID=1227495 RepID=L9YJV8_9EURY|nr:hypothetical protein [Natrinema pallidum]ELY73218.1 hypothetical protein C487_17490 [Natrinema pallidum DSM 3751]
MAPAVSPEDLRPADLLILYYCYANGQGPTPHIADSIARNADYTSTRITTLIEEWNLLKRVGSETGPVTLTQDGLELIEPVADCYLLPDQRERIQSATEYSVSWE